MTPKKTLATQLFLLQRPVAVMIVSVTWLFIDFSENVVCI